MDTDNIPASLISFMELRPREGCVGSTLPSPLVIRCTSSILLIGKDRQTKESGTGMRTCVFPIPVPKHYSPPQSEQNSNCKISNPLYMIDWLLQMAVRFLAVMIYSSRGQEKPAWNAHIIEIQSDP